MSLHTAGYIDLQENKCRVTIKSTLENIEIVFNVILVICLFTPASLHVVSLSVPLSLSFPVCRCSLNTEECVLRA